MRIPSDILELKKKFTAAGKELFLVGGCVRDHLLGTEPVDFDLVTDAVPDEIEKILAGYEMDATGKKFCVMRVRTTDNPKKGYEIATYREDISVGRKPQVKVSTIDKDAGRRDFTINALYWDMDANKPIDLVGGMEDVKKRVIRTPGNPTDRFNEDRLRVLRAIRFAARIGGWYDKTVEDAIFSDNKLIGPDEDGKMIPISTERIVEEFLKGIEQSKSVKQYLADLEVFGMYEQILGVLNGDVVIESRIPEIVISYLMGEESFSVDYLIHHRGFTKKIAEGVRFFKMFNSINENNVLNVNKQWRKTSLTVDHVKEYISFLPASNDNIKNMEAFTRYKVTTDGNDLVKQGFVGADVDKEMKRIEKQKFLELTNG